MISLLNANETVFLSHVEGCLRLWEITGQPVNAQVEIAGLGSLTHPVHTDLLETDRKPLQCVPGKPILPLKGSGVEAMRLV